ncbi:DUF4906 domain-containing protein [Bacteroides ihuae]|uniref:DUF4906 domain-containing protein n=1 Tax=Bacteroides ihuae TaxID=1852362 RepID=UPI0008DA4F61|nr:DUF4906 domain-containing protein [Bacteroides ihuae]
MRLVKNKIDLIIGIGAMFLLMIACTRDDLSGSEKQSETVQVHFNLQPIDMGKATSFMTRANSGNKESLSIGMGGSDNEVGTRSSTGISESAIDNVCVFQFNGTAPTSTLISKNYYSSLSSMNLVTSLTENAGIQTVYVVANVDDLTGSYTVNSTSLSAFQSSVYAMSTEASVTSSADLPMIGTYVGATMPGLYAVSLTRMVAKLGFTCNVSLTNTSDAFTITSVRLYSVANVTQMNTPTGTYPANSTTDASKYTNYTAESYTPGNMLTWYIPENLRGTVSTITTEQEKSRANAPAYSTYIEVEGLYTPSGSTTEYVTYRLYPGTNMTTNFDIARNTYYSISMTIKGMNEVDSRVLLPENMSINNAGTQVTANCYIANDANQNYKFKATVMGNGATTAAVSAQSGSGITPTTLAPTTVLLLWETGSKGDVIEDGSVKLVSGYVRFKTADNSTNGNAVIAVTDGTKILWSWHIWRVDYDPDTEYDTYKKYSSTTTFKMMKYNLGATEISNWSGTVTNAGDLGLLYQWGRKDPFVGGKLWATTNNIDTYNSSGYAWLDGTNSTAIANATSGTDAATSIAYSIKNPTHFIVYNATTGDWLNASANSAQRDNLWGNPNSGTAPNTLAGSKSIYDPCPPGWRVPTQDSYQIFTLNGANGGTMNVVSTTMSNGYNFYIAGTSGTSSFWPASGFRSNSTGALLSVSSYGFYWSSSSFGTGFPMYAGYLGFYSSDVSQLNGNNRSFGCPVRCAQE